MKALKIFLIIVVLLVGIFFLLAAVLPKDFHVERSLTITAPVSIVYEQLNSFANINTWSPWKEYDSAMVVTVEGSDGQIGCVSSWKGNKDVGSGSMEITKLQVNERVEMKIIFNEPMQSENKGYYQIDDKGGSVIVTWGIDGATPFPWNVLSFFMDIDATAGKDFERGLEKLKVISEELTAKNKTYRGFKIEQIEFEQRMYIARMDTVQFDGMLEFYSSNFGQIFQAVQVAGLIPQGGASGLFYTWDPENQKSYMGAAVQVQPVQNAVAKGFETLSIGSANGLKIEYFGAYEGSGEAHMAMDEYIQEKGLTQLAPVIEEYVVGPGQEADTTKWQTFIYYLVE